MLKIKGISEISLINKCNECKDSLTLNKQQQANKDKLWNLLFESAPTPIKENVQFEQTIYKVHTFTLAVILKNMEELSYRNGINILVDKVITEIIENNTLNNDYHIFAINAVRMGQTPNKQTGETLSNNWTITGVDTQDLWYKSDYKYFNEVVPLLLNATPIWCFGGDFLDEIKKDIKNRRVAHYIHKLNPIFFRYHLSNFEAEIEKHIAELKKYY